MTADPDSPVARGQQARSGWALAAAVLLVALNLRTAVSSVGPLLDELRTGLGMSGPVAGLLTTLPVLSFAALGSVTPRLAHRVGERRALSGALVLMTAGLLLRATAPSPWAFLLFSVVALAGGAMGNVLLPVLVKRHFPDRIGGMTAGYTTALAVGTTLAAAVTVPLAGLRGGSDWRLGLGSWAVLSGVAAVGWLLATGRGARAGGSDAERVVLPLRRSRTAWALAIYFGTQSLQAYVAFGWFALFFRQQAGVSAARAGLLLAVMAALSIPTSMVLPTMAARWRSQRPLVVGLVGCYLVAYVAMLAAPAGGAWVEVVLVGVGAGAFPLALTMIGLRTRTTAATAALSAFAQSVGYLVAGVGPLLVGVLHGATGSWTWPFVLLFVALAVQAVSGWYAGGPRYVEDDLAGRPAR